MIGIKDKNGKKFKRNNENEIKIAFIDLDGTLLDNNQEISNINLQSLIKAQNKGIKIVFTTGRLLLSVKKIVGDNKKKCNFNFFPGIYLNGSIVFDENGKLIVNKYINRKLLLEIIEFFKKLNMIDFAVFYTLDNYFSLSMNDKTQNVENLEKVSINLINENDLKKLKVYKILFCLDKHIMQNNLKLLREKFSSKLNVVNSFQFFIELYNYNINKFEGVKKICELYNINLNNALSIGDGENDKEMLDGLSNSIALSNATNKVQKCAKYIGPSNIENGVAEVLQTFCNI